VKVKLVFDLSFIPLKWWRCVTGLKSKNEIAVRVDRKHFEACLCTFVSEDLQSGDLAVAGSDRFSDYRNDLVGDNEFRERLIPYAKTVGLAVDRPHQFINDLKEKLKSKILEVDTNFPKSASLRIDDGEPILSKAPRKSDKKRLSELEELIRTRLDTVTILDILSDTESWINWSRFFKCENRSISDTEIGPISDSISDPSRTLRRNDLGQVNERH
jgi:hypothetical protein